MNDSAAVVVGAGSMSAVRITSGEARYHVSGSATARIATRPTDVAIGWRRAA